MLTLKGINLPMPITWYFRARASAPQVKLLSADGLEGLVGFVVVIPLLQITPAKQIVCVGIVWVVSQHNTFPNDVHYPIASLLVRFSLSIRAPFYHAA
jgi:hypothetical protein